MNIFMKNIALFLFLTWLTALRLTAQSCTPVTTCLGSPVNICDLTPNDATFWNETYWEDIWTGLNDLSDAPTDLTVNATDTCGAGLTFKYLLFLDLNNDGVQETVVKSWDPPAPGTVNFDNALLPNYDGGEVRNFDERPVTASQKYQFSLQETVNGASATAALRWNPPADPGTYTIPGFPYGTHKIQWFVSNNLSNETTCEYTFVVKDCKAPTIVCINGLFVNILQNGELTLWAADFLQYTEDNATPTSLMQLGIRKSGTGTGFPQNGTGAPYNSLPYDCLELGQNQIELWSRDLAGNADYCEIYFILQDNSGFCPSTLQVKACARCGTSNILEEATLAFTATRPALPDVTVNSTGCVNNGVNEIPVGSSYTITPSYDSNPLNGISTYDGVLIAKHMLGTELLNTPYKLIGADVDHDGFVGINDIRESRRLILGIYTDLPKNTSWRFVPADYVFPNPNFPSFPPFPEKIKVENITDTTPVEYEFISIKIGDVNTSSTCNNFSPNLEDRSSVAVALPDLGLAAGETLDLPLHFTEAGEWLGLQVSLRFDPNLIEIEQVTPGNLPNFSQADFAQPVPGLIRAAWSDGLPVILLPNDPIFTLRVRALAPVNLRDAVTLASDRFEPEVYDAASVIHGLNLVFQEKISGTDDPDQTIVLAPQPNPTSEGFNIPIRLKQTSDVRLDIVDLTGKVLYQNTLSYSEGSHLLSVPAAALPQFGMYMWRVEVGQQIVSGKVVRM